jgi:hypothetical protein
VLVVAPACEGDDILLLLDCNKELFGPYRDQNLLEGSYAIREKPLVWKAMLLRGGGVLYERNRVCRSQRPLVGFGATSLPARHAGAMQPSGVNSLVTVLTVLLYTVF